jgi:hypothetical protein
MTEDRKSVLTIRVPRGLKARIEKYSVLEGVSINQFALYAFAKEIAQLETNRYFRQRLRGKKKEEVVAAFDAVMAAVPDRRPPKWDQQREQAQGEAGRSGAGLAPRQRVGAESERGGRRRAPSGSRSRG